MLIVQEAETKTKEVIVARVLKVKVSTLHKVLLSPPLKAGASQNVPYIFFDFGTCFRKASRHVSTWLKNSADMFDPNNSLWFSKLSSALAVMCVRLSGLVFPLSRSCFPSGPGCCDCLAGLVSGLVSHIWSCSCVSCLQSCLPSFKGAGKAVKLTHSVWNDPSPPTSATGRETRPVLQCSSCAFQCSIYFIQFRLYQTIRTQTIQTQKRDWMLFALHRFSFVRM